MIHFNSCLATLALCGGAFASIIPVSSYSYVNAPYGYYDSGNELTDGVWSTTGINPSDLWVGWSSAHAKIDFDFGSVQSPAAATIIFCQWGGAAVYLPTHVSFELSEFADFSNSTTLTYLSDFDGSHGGVTVQRDYDFSNDAPNARYVRLSADHDNQWIFIGEVQFFDVPAPGAAIVFAAAGIRPRRRVIF
ncbi:MAG: hypothetical protein K8R92_11005 [Planctomycetes bacterium]|nr:hypothetical protein [Planctomycetota bacterium]